MQKQKRKIMGAVATLVAPLLLTPSVWAWGPENRPTFTNNEPAHYAVFNSITDNAAVGDERDFVRVEEKNSGREYANQIDLEAGKQYEVYIYYHNDASATFNTKDHNYIGVARDVRLSSYFPHELAKDEKGVISGKIIASNTDPKEVWDEAYVTAKQAMTLHYVEGSARIYNKYGVNGSVLSTNLFSDMGTFIGLDKLNGVILGCDEYSGQIVYTIQTIATEVPVDPETPTDPEKPTDPEEPVKPVLPNELPTTGPIEIILAIVVLAAIIAGIVYWRKSKKAVKHITKKVKNKK